MSRPHDMRVVCSWCEAVLQIGASDQPTSHGICAGCSRALVGEDRGDEPPLRFGLIAHLREQIKADPEGFANGAKLRIVADKLTDVMRGEA